MRYEIMIHPYLSAVPLCITLAANQLAEAGFSNLISHILCRRTDPCCG